MDYFKYKWIVTDQNLTIDQTALNSLEVSTNSSLSRHVLKQLQQQQSEQNRSSNTDSTAPSMNLNSWIAGELQVSKSLCWPFSKTIRVDIRPLCLCVNKTEHSVLLIEKNSSHEVDYDIEPNIGIYYS